jgi:hypothetical protein
VIATLLTVPFRYLGNLPTKRLSGSPYSVFSSLGSVVVMHYGTTLLDARELNTSTEPTFAAELNWKETGNSEKLCQLTSTYHAGSANCLTCHCQMLTDPLTSHLME